MMNKIDENAPEYYALASIVSDDQADIAIADLRKNRTAVYLAEKTGKSEQEARKLALSSRRSAFFASTRTHCAASADQFFMQIFAPGIMEMLNNPKQLAEHPEVGRKRLKNTRVSAWRPCRPCCRWDPA